MLDCAARWPEGWRLPLRVTRGSRYWFYSVGPFANDAATALATDLQRLLDNGPQRFGVQPEEPGVDIIDDRVWYVCAFDVASAETLMAILRGGVRDEPAAG